MGGEECDTANVSDVPVIKFVSTMASSSIVKDKSDGDSSKLSCLGEKCDGVGDNNPSSSMKTVSETIEITEEAQHDQSISLETPMRVVHDDISREEVSLNIPHTPKRVTFSPLRSPTCGKIGEVLSAGPSPRGIPSIRNLFSKQCLRGQNSVTDTEATSILVLGVLSSDTEERPPLARTMSLSKLFSPQVKSPISLPISPILHSNPESMHGKKPRNTFSYLKAGPELHIHRSHSVPAFNKNGSPGPVDSSGIVFRLVPTPPHLHVTENIPPTTDTDGVGGVAGEDVMEEEAVCRICFVALGEGAETFKMECRCKGDLALAHQECTVKWFSMKGNRTCDVCKHDVQNLPVTLLRIQNAQSLFNLRGMGADHAGVVQQRVCHDVPILVIVSMLAYFCFLEQLLVRKLGSGAIAISLPFSCILGLLASMTSSTMVRRKYAWGYAGIQFFLVVLFGYVFYALFHMQPVLAVLVAAFAGFAVAMFGNSLSAEVNRLRTSLAREDTHVGETGTVPETPNAGPGESQHSRASQGEPMPSQNA